MIHLASVSLKLGIPQTGEFPFNLAVFRSLDKVEFHSPVTFLVGENGSGKSTLLEAIAAGLDAITVGGADVSRDDSLAHIRPFAKHFRFSWHHKTRRGFFLRAEDFFRFARRVTHMRNELLHEAAEYERTLTGEALARAKGTMLGQVAEMESRYGKDLDANSHGESFLKLFQARFVPDGLYLLDEPEVPLSPQRQLTLISMLKDMVSQNGQFIIATHSPILMAFPQATILSFDHTPLREVPYAQLEHVTLTRDFLACPERYLRNL
jgi:predicted ATPase